MHSYSALTVTVARICLEITIETCFICCNQKSNLVYYFISTATKHLSFQMSHKVTNNSLSKFPTESHCLTGLTDKMRADFHIMKDLSIHTRLTPQQREERLNRFISTIQK